jgi:hypothetical protein
VIAVSHPSAWPFASGPVSAEPCGPKLAIRIRRCCIGLAFISNSYISATTGELRGIPAAEPVLQLTFDLEAGGLSDGTTVLLPIHAHIQADGAGTVALGQAMPVVKQLGFRPRPDDAPYETQVQAEWSLSDAAIESIEKARNGGGFTIHFTLGYTLISQGTAAPTWPQPQVPVRVPWPGNPTSERVDAHDWADKVLGGWQLASAVSIVVPLPAGSATDEHRVIAERLTTAKQLLQAGTPDSLKASVAASREACELLRKMRPAAVNAKAQQRTLAEREAVILDKMTELAQALFDYDSAASHTDPHLRDIAWRRENAVLALGTAASLAQLIFART